jgi:hypothetical protein
VHNSIIIGCARAQIPFKNPLLLACAINIFEFSYLNLSLGTVLLTVEVAYQYSRYCRRGCGRRMIEKDFDAAAEQKNQHTLIGRVLLESPSQAFFLGLYIWNFNFHLLLLQFRDREGYLRVPTHIMSKMVKTSLLGTLVTEKERRL